MHSIFHHWACILIFEGCFIEYVCWWEFACEFFDTLHSLYSLHLFLEWNTGNLLLRAQDHCPFHHYIHWWCDFTPYLIWVDHHFSLYTHHFAIILVIACDSSHSLHPLCYFLTRTYSKFDVSLASFLRISLLVWFASSSHYWYYIHRYPRVHGSWAFLYTLHFIHEGMGFLSLGIWA